MRILYGVVGEGMGHATRSVVSLEHLLRAGHRVRVVVSGRAHRFLKERLAPYDNLTIYEIHGLSLEYEGNRVRKGKSLRSNLKAAPKGLRKNFKVYRQIAETGFEPEVVISDFESWAAFYALNNRLPVISIDNMQIINRCTHPKEVTGKRGKDARVARLAVKAKLPGAYHYLVSSYFYPQVRKKRTTLVPPILRQDIVDAKREPGQHVIVYQTSTTNKTLARKLSKLPHEFRIYGMGKEGTEGNLTYRAFSETGFVEDLRTARAAIAGGGFSLLSEAVSLRVPLLSIPLEAQYEQELNARYLAHLGYGAWARSLDVEKASDFISRSDEYAHALASYQPADNSMLLGCLDELLERCRLGQEPPVRLSAPAMGKYGDEDGVPQVPSSEAEDRDRHPGDDSADAAS